MKADLCVAVYDVETGGLQALKNPMVEIAICPFSTYKLEDLPEYESGTIAPYDYLHTVPDGEENPFEELNSQIQECIDNKDGRRWMEITKTAQKNGFNGLVINQGALMANGIAIEKIMDGRPIKEVFTEMLAYFKSLKSGRNKPILTGHNIDDFDNPYIDYLFAKFGKDKNEFISKSTIDTLLWSRLERNESPSYKLGVVCENQGIILKDAHRAVTDTRATKQLIKTYIQKLRGNAATTQESGIQPKFRDNFEI